MMSLNIFSKRYYSFSVLIRLFFVLSAMLALLWLVSIVWFLNKSQADFLSEYQIDKILHFSGGFLVAGLVFIAFGKNSRSGLIFAVLGIGILWEAWELIFLSDQFIRFQTEFALWALDSFFDVISDILGAYFLYETSFADRE